MKIKSIIIGISIGVIFMIILSLVIYRNHKDDYNNTLIAMQNEPNNFESKKLQDANGDLKDSGNCTFSTKHLTSAKGVDMTVYIPCTWQKYNDNSGNDIVQQFALQKSDYSGLSFLITVAKMNKTLSDDDINKLSSKQHLISTLNQAFSFSSCKNLSVNGFKSTRLIATAKSDNSFAYYITYYIYDNDKIIHLVYQSVYPNEEEANNKISNDIKLIETLVYKTKINS